MMTQPEFDQRVAEAKKDCAARVAAAQKEYEAALSDIRRRRQELNVESKYIDEMRNRYIKAAYAEYREAREALEAEHRAAVKAQRANGQVLFNDMRRAVSTIQMYLRQEGNEGIVMPWGKDRCVEIQFRTSTAEQEGGEA